MKILSVVGARPNFMKVAPLHRAFQKRPGIESVLVHTGQHFDARMSEVFFDQLGLPNPDYHLGVRSGTHTWQTAQIMLAFEEILEKERPDWVLVVGDVNSTLACALVAAKTRTPVAHVEAGLRSGDRSMPEEINRILTDAVSELLFVTEQAGLDNLKFEGIPPEKVFLVGNCMIDSLLHAHTKAVQCDTVSKLGLRPCGYALMTMHRPVNVDSAQGLEIVVKMAERIARYLPVIFPMHPRTQQNLDKFGLLNRFSQEKYLLCLPPQGYFEFLNLMENAAVVLTDSGGIQEETTFLQVPCLTFRATTERPVTVEIGSNELIADLDPGLACAKTLQILQGNWKKGQIPPLWDGQASERIADIFLQQSS